MKLFIANKVYSSWSLRGWLVARSCGPVEEVVVPLFQDDSRERILRYSPSGKLPCLIDGQVVVWDSLAILEHLHEKHPHAGLYPAGIKARALHRSICAEIHSGFPTLRSVCGMNIRREPAPKAVSPPLAVEIARLEEIVAALPSPPAERADRVSGVEAFLTPIGTRFRTYQLPMSEGMRSYFVALLAHPLFREWEKAAFQEPWSIPEFDAL